MYVNYFSIKLGGKRVFFPPKVVTLQQPGYCPHKGDCTPFAYVLRMNCLSKQTRLGGSCLQQADDIMSGINQLVCIESHCILCYERSPLKINGSSVILKQEQLSTRHSTPCQIAVQGPNLLQPIWFTLLRETDSG